MSQIINNEITTNITTNNKETDNMNCIDILMNEANKYELLTAEQEQDCAKLIHGQDAEKSQAALDLLVMSNLRLLVKLANEAKERGLDVEDLVSEGFLGLNEAARRFLPGTGAKFSTYACDWIRQKMYKAIGQYGKTVRVPVNAQRAMSKIYKAKTEFFNQYNHDATLEELSEMTGLTVKHIHSLELRSQMTISLQDPFSEGEDGTIEDVVMDDRVQTPDVNMDGNDLYQKLYQGLEKLNDREKLIIDMRFFQNKTLEEVSAALGRTRERVRQLQMAAINKLKKWLGNEYSYLLAAN